MTRYYSLVALPYSQLSRPINNCIRDTLLVIVISFAHLSAQDTEIKKTSMETEITTASDWELGDVPNIGVDKENRKALTTMLNKILADEYVLYTKVRNYHWNVLGIHFHDLHIFFDKIYEQLTGFVDTIAERVRALGGKSYGTLQEFIDASRLSEHPGEAPSPEEMVENLLADFELISSNMHIEIDDAYDKYGDIVTNNMLTDILTAHEKTAWMLRAIADKTYGRPTEETL